MPNSHTVPFLALLLALPLWAGCGGDADAASDAGPAPEASAAGAPAASAPTASTAPSDADAEVMVYKTPACGCCQSWAEHLRAEGFEVEVRDEADLTAIKGMLGVPPRARSCHTALVDGYVVEGHVPASTIRRLLSERPEVAGVAVPGMPIGSPGMEVEGRAADPYDVLAFDAEGSVRVYEKH